MTTASRELETDLVSLGHKIPRLNDLTCLCMMGVVYKVGHFAS